MTAIIELSTGAEARPHRPALSSGAGALVAALSFLPRRLARWARCRRDLRYLSSLEDRMLHDIGISRSEVERAVFRGRP